MHSSVKMRDRKLFSLLFILISHHQGPTSTLYSNRTRIFLSYSNPTRKFLKNDRVASSMYSSHFRKIAALPPCCSKDKVSLSEHQMPKAEQAMKLFHSNTWFIFFQEEKLTIFSRCWQLICIRSSNHKSDNILLFLI